jgi:Neocarzinostatin family
MIGKSALKALAGCVVVTGLVVSSGLPASAAPKGKVSPNKNLVNGQSLTVSAKGFPANDGPLVVVECTLNVLTSNSQNDCDTSNVVGTTASSKGKVGPVSFTFHTGPIGTNGNTCDHGQTCVIVISEVTTSSPNESAIKVKISKTASP